MQSPFKDGNFRNALESERLEAVTVRIRGRVVGLAVGLSIIAVAATFQDAVVLGVAAIIALLTGQLVNSLISGGKIKRFSNRHKAALANTLLQEVGPNLKFEPTKGISENLFLASGLYSKRSDRYHTEDLCHGKLGNTYLQFAEIKSEYKTTSTDSDGDSQTTWHTTFQGVYFIADFNKHFRTEVTITPDFAEKTFGFVGRKLQSLKGNVIHLENEEFEKAFIVQGTDDQETRYILTPAVQENLLKLRKIHGKDMRLSFRESSLCLAAPTTHNYFETNLKLPVDHPEQTDRIRWELKRFLNIVETLDLNTRIWTKE